MAESKKRSEETEKRPSKNNSPISYRRPSWNSDMKTLRGIFSHLYLWTITILILVLSMLCPSTYGDETCLSETWFDSDILHEVNRSHERKIIIVLCNRNFWVVRYGSTTWLILTNTEIFVLYQIMYIFLYVRLYGEQKPCFYFYCSTFNKLAAL